MELRSRKNASNELTHSNNSILSCDLYTFNHSSNCAYLLQNSIAFLRNFHNANGAQTLTRCMFYVIEHYVTISLDKLVQTLVRTYM